MFFKVLLVILGIFILIRLAFRGLLSYFLGGMTRNADNQIRQQEELLRQKKKKREGEVSINYQPKQGKNFDKKEGDYIDFEEVK